MFGSTVSEDADTVLHDLDNALNTLSTLPLHSYSDSEVLARDHRKWGSPRQRRRSRRGRHRRARPDRTAVDQRRRHPRATRVDQHRPAHRSPRHPVSHLHPPTTPRHDHPRRRLLLPRLRRPTPVLPSPPRDPLDRRRTHPHRQRLPTLRLPPPRVRAPPWVHGIVATPDLGRCCRS